MLTANLGTAIVTKAEVVEAIKGWTVYAVGLDVLEWSGADADALIAAGELIRARLAEQQPEPKPESSTKQELVSARDYVAMVNEEALFLDGPEFDAALIGYMRRFSAEAVAAYDYEKVIAILMKDGMTREEAEEHFEFNIIGGWHGESTPCFVSLSL